MRRNVKRYGDSGRIYGVGSGFAEGRRTRHNGREDPTIFPAGYLRLGYREFGLSEAGPLIIEVNTYLTILAGPQVILFDAYTLLSENGLVKAEYTLDLLHLNAAGYEALNRSLAPLLTDLAQTRASG